MTLSGLCVPLPRADAFLSRWRDNHDYTAACGLSAHVTVYMPFPGEAALSPESVASVHDAHFPLSVRLSHLEDRPGALVVVVEPDHELRSLTASLQALDAGLPQHREGRDFRYHATLVRTPDPEVRRAASLAVSEHLPHVEECESLWRFDWEESSERLKVVWRTSLLP